MQPRQRSYGQAKGRAEQPARTADNTQPWPVSTPEPWEQAAVDLTHCTNRQKNLAWRNIKQDAPDVAQAMARDIPALQEAFGHIGVEVDANYIKE